MASGDHTEADISVTNPCGCVNGVCRMRGTELYCACYKGFEGEKCDKTEISFVFTTGKNSTYVFNDNFAIAVSFACLAVIIVAIVGFLVWRRTSRLRKQRNWVKWQESRRQSKATIEGSTFVETSSKQGQSNPSFQPDIPKDSNNCKNVFVFHADLNNKDLEKQERISDSEWIKAMNNERHCEIPVIHNCLGSDSHLSLMLNKNEFSFLSCSPTGLAKGTLARLPKTDSRRLKFENETNTERKSEAIKVDDNATEKNGKPVLVQENALNQPPLNTVCLHQHVSQDEATQDNVEKRRAMDIENHNDSEKDFSLNDNRS